MEEKSITPEVPAIHRRSRPHVAVMGGLPGTTVHRKVARNPEALAQRPTVVLRIGASLYVAKAAFLKEKLRHVPRQHSLLQVFIFDACPGIRLDAGAVDALPGAIEDLPRDGTGFNLAGVKGRTCNAGPF